jgi:hypothetical protein
VAKEGVAAAGGSVWDGGTKAVARSVGIDADGDFVSDAQKTTLTVNGSGATIVHSDTKQGASGQDIVINHGAITTKATAETDVAAVAVVTKGLSAAFSQSTSTAAADAIRGGDASDFITNTGALSSTAEAKARSLNIAVTTDKGVAIAGNGVWDGGVKADATAVGISGDGGAGFDPDTPTKSTTTIRVGGGDLIGTEGDEGCRAG